MRPSLTAVREHDETDTKDTKTIANEHENSWAQHYLDGYRKAKGGVRPRRRAIIGWSDAIAARLMESSPAMDRFVDVISENFLLIA